MANDKAAKETLTDSALRKCLRRKKAEETVARITDQDELLIGAAKKMLEGLE